MAGTPRPRRPSGWTLGLANLLGVLVLYFAVPVSTDAPLRRLLFDLAATLLGAGMIAYVVFRELRSTTPVGDERLTPVRLVLMLEIVLVAFALTYYTLAVNLPGEMVGISTRIDALYFTASTMSTVGYGDVHAEGQVGRAVATVHLLFDVVFLAAFARLITRRLARRRAEDDQDW